MELNVAEVADSVRDSDDDLIDLLWERSNHGTKREDICKAFYSGKCHQKRLSVDEWWNSVCDSVVWSGAYAGIKWDGMWPDGKEDIRNIYSAMIVYR